jgi:hypothetical protein
MAPCHELTKRFAFASAIAGGSPKSRNVLSKRLVIRCRFGEKSGVDGEKRVYRDQSQKCPERTMNGTPSRNNAQSLPLRMAGF